MELPKIHGARFFFYESKFSSSLYLTYIVFRRDFCYYISDIDARNYNPALSTGRSAEISNSDVFLMSF